MRTLKHVACEGSPAGPWRHVLRVALLKKKLGLGFEICKIDVATKCLQGFGLAFQGGELSTTWNRF